VLKFYLALTIAILLTGIGGGCYYYYTDTQKKIALLTEKNSALVLSNQQCEETLEAVRTNFSDAERNITNLQKRLSVTENYKNELQNKLRRHDLTKLTLKKPGLIEKRINDATEQIFKNLESDTAL
jgi:uncharacterized protein YeeX (DUF496 family)